MIPSHVDTSITTLHEKSLKKTPNLEDLYLKFCNSIWPHLYTIGNIFLLAKTSRRHQSLKIPRNTLKMSFFVYTRLALKETRVWHATCQLYNLRVILYATLYTRNPRILFMYVTVVFNNLCMPLKNVKNMPFEFRVVWVVMQLTSSVVTTLSSTLTLH